MSYRSSESGATALQSPLCFPSKQCFGIRRHLAVCFVLASLGIRISVPVNAWNEKQQNLEFRAPTNLITNHARRCICWRGHLAMFGTEPRRPRQCTRTICPTECQRASKLSWPHVHTFYLRARPLLAHAQNCRGRINSVKHDKRKKKVKLDNFHLRS